tara:strand:+ start:1001 stop:1486 length:486 start_codon:yes stop_codon:yes gene_type:complete
MDERIKEFFIWSDLFDYMVTRQLSHIRSNWELIWDHAAHEYEEEEDSYAELINSLVIELSELDPPLSYHDNEDRLAEYCKTSLNWDIKKVGNRWVGSDYASILEQGAFREVDASNLCMAACGRVKAALDRNQLHFDDMEEFHRKMLADVVAIILFHRGNNA